MCKNNLLKLFVQSILNSLESLSFMKFIILLTLFLSSLAHAELKVATLHPLLTDLAKQIGGEHVKVVDLIGSSDPHTFNPSPSTLSKASGARIYLAAGKGLEPYLGKLQSSLGSSVVVYEVGKPLASLTFSKENAVYACCPAHTTVGKIDPHWWHSTDAWRRAAQGVSKQFASLDPANKKAYKANAKAFRSKMKSLSSSLKVRFSKIPSDRRNLTTAHAAFAYFCKEFRFKSIPVQGISKEQAATSKYLATAIETVKAKKVAAIFPEVRSNPKSLKSIAQATGARIGKPLIADGSDSIEGMFLTNAAIIIDALK